MRRAIQTLYSLILRVTGLFGLLHVVLFLLHADAWEAQNMGHPFPVIFMALFILFSFLLTFRQRWLSAVVATPRHPLSLLAIVPGGVVLTTVFVLGTMSSIVVMQMAEPQSRNIAILSGLVSWGLFSLAGLLGMILGVWTAPDDPPPPRKTAKDPFARLHRA